jgi:mannose-6-phosphate isomerase-like protein (cupin superfamily)
MDKLSAEILKSVIGEDVAPRPSRPHNPIDHWSPPILLERAAYLRKMARVGDGSASETLRDYSQHAAMLSFRGRSGEAEVHENFADLFYVLAGEASLVTGGSLVHQRNVGPGETRGDAIEGGTRQSLRAGEIAHVPAGVPHQMLLAGEKTLTCFVIKVLENPPKEP